MTVSTNDIMRIGLDLVGWNRMPHDSAIHVKGNSIQKVLITIDVSTSELIPGKENWLRRSDSTPSDWGFVYGIPQSVR